MKIAQLLWRLAHDPPPLPLEPLRASRQVAFCLDCETRRAISRGGRCGGCGSESVMIAPLARLPKRRPKVRA